MIPSLRTFVAVSVDLSEDTRANPEVRGRRAGLTLDLDGADDVPEAVHANSIAISADHDQIWGLLLLWVGQAAFVEQRLQPEEQQAGRRSISALPNILDRGSQL